MLHWIDLLIILSFILYAVFSGFKNKNEAEKNLEEYFLAGRSLPGWKAGISMAATQFAADTPLLVMGLIATAGIFSLWRLWIYALAFLLMGFVLARSWRRANVLTDAELTEVRYGNKAALWLRGIKAIYFGTIINCTVMAMVLLAATRIAEPFLLWHQWLPSDLYELFLGVVQWVNVPFTAQATSPEVWTHSTNNLISIFVIIGVTTLYSTTGGLRSVVATDVVQFFIMTFATLAYAVYVIYHAGGLSNIIDKIHEIYASTASGLSGDHILAFTPSQAFELSAPLAVVLGFQWLIQMNSDGTGYLAQRSMACRSEKDAKIAAVVFSFTQVFLRSLLWLPIGLGLLVVFPPGEIGDLTQFAALREATFVSGIAELLPIGLRGLLLTGMLAALASTIDTHLNWGASYWSNDLYKRLYCEVWRGQEADQKKLILVARLSNIAILLIALFIMANLSSIQTAWQASLILGASMGIPLILRWLWWRMNSWGEVFAIIASLVMTPILLIGYPEINEASKLLLMAAVSLISCLCGVYLMGPEPKKVLQNFYQRVHPPGFWGPISHNAKSDRRQLIFSLGAMVTCALCIFTLLVGIGSWLVQAPAPTWLPHRPTWIAINVGVGLILIPVWLSLGFKKEK